MSKIYKVSLYNNTKYYTTREKAKVFVAKRKKKMLEKIGTSIDWPITEITDPEIIDNVIQKGWIKQSN